MWLFKCFGGLDILDKAVVLLRRQRFTSSSLLQEVFRVDCSVGEVCFGWLDGRWFLGFFLWSSVWWRILVDDSVLIFGDIDVRSSVVVYLLQACNYFELDSLGSLVSMTRLLTVIFNLIFNCNILS